MTSCCGVGGTLVTTTGMVGISSESKSWSWSLPGSVSQHVQLISLNIDKVSKVSFPSYWHILGLSTILFILGEIGGLSRPCSTGGGVTGPPFSSFPDSALRSDCKWEHCNQMS